MRFRDSIRGTSSLAVIAFLAFAGQAYAQEQSVAADAGVETEEDLNTVDQIVVTAQKREQNLQDVPIVVTSLAEEVLDDAGVRDIKDLTVLTPGLLVTSTSNETVTTARIRGVGTVGDNPGLESSVGVVIDGVYRPRNGVGFGDLGEIERIEVLKGPQGTLFGKNTSAGVINILTKDPSFQFGGEAEVTAGSYGELGGSASVTGPLSETVAARLFVASRERDGLYDTQVAPPRTLTEDNDRNFETVRGQLLFRPTPQLSARLIADFTKRAENCCLGVNIVRGPTQAALDALVAGGATSNPVAPFDRITHANRSTEQSIEDKGLSAELNWDTPWFGGAALTSITAWRNWQTINGQDSDFSRADLLYRNPDGSFGREFDQFTQEFRLAGATDRLNWLVGAFFANEKLDSSESLLIGTQLEPYLGLVFSGGASPNGLTPLTGLVSNFTPGTGGNDQFNQRSKSFALFTNNSFDITEQLEITAGLRWTMEDKELESQYRNTYDGRACAAARARAAVIGPALGATAPLFFGYICAAPFADPAFNNTDTFQSREEREWSGTLKAAYRFNPDIMTYASYARGYKGGGYNLDRARVSPLVSSLNPDTSFAPEFVDSFELGSKTTWLQRSLLLNATVFHQTFTDFQLNTFTGISFIVTSVPEVVSRGVDADFLWFTPVDGLTLQGGVTYAETQYGDDRPSAIFQPGGSSFRLPGSRLSFAPLWSSSFSATYERDIGGALRFRTSANAKHTSTYNTGSDLLPSKIQPEMVLFNGRVGIGAQDERWMVELWGQNLTDEEYYQVGFDATLQFGAVNAFLGNPRTFGATLRLKY